MPIVVDEVVISVEVADAGAGGSAAPGGAGASAPAAEGRRAIVAECVERVLEILRDREER